MLYHRYMVRVSLSPSLLTFAILLAFFSIVVFGWSHSFGMEMRDDGMMSGCLFTGMDEICTMTFTEHLSAWQSMFNSIPVKSTIPSLLVLAIALLLFAGFLKRYFIWALERMASLQVLYLIHHPNLSFFHPLREAFSQGILNPKIY